MNGIALPMPDDVLPGFLVELRHALGIPAGADAVAEIESHRAALPADRWTELCRSARQRAEQALAAERAAAQAERKRAGWVAFEARAAGTVEAVVLADNALAALAAAVHDVRAKTAAAREAFPGDPSVSSFFDVADLTRRAELAALRSVNGAGAESLAATARNALALIERIHAAEEANNAR